MSPSTAVAPARPPRRTGAGRAGHEPRLAFVELGVREYTGEGRRLTQSAPGALALAEQLDGSGNSPSRRAPAMIAPLSSRTSPNALTAASACTAVPSESDLACEAESAATPAVSPEQLADGAASSCPDRTSFDLAAADGAGRVASDGPGRA